MIKFYRKIRQKLLSENKFSKYLIYAAGEIVLVVIGILIALQINNWNNNRIATNQMTAYLRSLKHDLETDTTLFNSSIVSNKEIINFKKYLKLSNFENVPTDSLEQLVVPFTALTEPVKTTFFKLTNSGITQISDNDSLSQKVYAYYTTKLDWLNEMTTFDELETTKDYDYWAREQDLYEFDYPEIPNFQNDIERINSILKLLSTTRARNNLKNDLDRKKRILEEYQWIKEEASKLIIDIDKELKKK